MADALEFDIGALDSLTVEQIEWMEEALGGVSLTEVLPTPENPNRPWGKVLRAFAYASVKTDNPEFTVADAGKIVVRLNGTSPNPPTKRAPRKRG